MTAESSGPGKVSGGSESTSSLAGRDSSELPLSNAPPWADGGVPDGHAYMESELFVAGALSTMEPFARYHPAWALPFARTALHALSEWEPTDDRDGEPTAWPTTR